MSSEKSEMALSIFEKSTQDKKLVALSLQHHNDAAAHAATVHTFLEGVVDECEEGEYKESLKKDLRAMWAGYHAANSHGGRLLQDHLTNSHKIFDGTDQKKGGSFLAGIFGKKDGGNK